MTTSGRRAKSAPASMPPVHASDLKNFRGNVTDVLPPERWGWRSKGAIKPMVLAFDPGVTCGWALLSRALGYRGGGGPFAVHALCQVITFAVEQARNEQIQLLVVCEAPLPQHNWEAAFSLCRKGGGLEWECTKYGLPIVFVKPVVWQDAMFGTRIDRNHGKALSIALAQAMVSPTIQLDHASDAALLARWALHGGRS